MKTKHLLTAMVLPAMLAACTAEEIETSKGMIQNDLNQRPTVGDVTLSFGDVKSRAALDENGLYNTIEFTENEDGIGARIIDSYEAAGLKDKDGNRVAWKDYTITDYASTNYRYVYNGDVWATNALMVEGNYMFYFPYNEKNLSRGPLEIITPTHQTVKPNEDGGEKNAIAELYAGENPVFVGYKFISAEEQELEQEVDMKPVFAYPYITLTNDFTTKVKGEDVGNDVTITKVVFFAPAGVLTEKYVVDHAKIQTQLTEKVTYTTASGESTLKAAGNWTDDAKLLKNATISSIATATGEDVEITVEFEDGLYLAYGEEYSFYVVLPAALYNAGALDMAVYTEGGKMFGTSVTVADVTTESPTTFDNAKAMRFAPGKRYATQEYNFPAGKKPAPKTNAGLLGVYEITGANLALIDEVAPAPVISTLPEFEEFLNGIDENTETLKEVTDRRNARYGEFVLAEAKDAEGNGLGYAELALNKEFLQLLEEYNYSGNIEFCSKMRAEGTASTTEQLVLDGITFGGGLIAAEGYTTVKDITLGAALTVEGGVLTINHDAPYAKAVEVKAGEAIVVNAEFIPETWSDINIITAGETLNATETAVVATGKVTLNYAGTSHLGGSRVKVAGGELVINSNVTAIVGSGTVWSKGAVTNNGVLSTASALTIGADVKLVNAGTVEGTLKNNGEIETSKNLTVAENNGTIKLTSNVALVTVAAGSADGIVDNTIAGKVKNSGSNAVVAYIGSLTNNGAAELRNYDPAAGITKYVLGGEWYVNRDTSFDKVVEFASNSSLNVGSDATLTLSKSVIIGANVTWSGRNIDGQATSIVNFTSGSKIIYNKYASVSGSTTLDTPYSLTVTDLTVQYNGTETNVELQKLNDAVDGDIVNLTGTINLASELPLNKNITIKGGTFTGSPIRVDNTAKVVFDGVTFNNGTGTDESSIYLIGSTKDITVKNCTFEGQKWDALQIVNIANNITVTIEGNTFNTLAENNDGGSYIHIANETELTNSDIVIKNNTFGAQEDKVNNDYMVKIYGVIAFDQIVAGGNYFVDAYSASAKQILINKSTSDDVDGANTYSAQTAYTKFEATTAAAL